MWFWEIYLLSEDPTISILGSEINTLNLRSELSSLKFSQHFLNWMIHEQVPLPVPCYDLPLLTELGLALLTGHFGHSQLAWVDGRISIVGVYFESPLSERISRTQRARRFISRFNFLISSIPFFVWCAPRLTRLAIRQKSSKLLHFELLCNEYFWKNGNILRHQ